MRIRRIMKIRCVFIVGTALAFFVAQGFAQLPFLLEPLGPVFSDRDGLAVRGADPVAYFTEKKMLKGTASFDHEWHGAKWLFASAQNRDTFAAQPEKFAPQYGGYCAAAVAAGAVAPTNPAVWMLVDGKLYLNFDKPTREQWKRDIPGHIKKADANWPGVLSE